MCATTPHSPVSTYDKDLEVVLVSTKYLKKQHPYTLETKPQVSHFPSLSLALPFPPYHLYPAIAGSSYYSEKQSHGSIKHNLWSGEARVGASPGGCAALS